VQELDDFVQPIWDENGDAWPSAFLTSIGVSSVDDDFLEVHFLPDDEAHAAFADYLRREYSPDESFAEHLPPKIDEKIRACNSIILLYGNVSPYGAVNDVLFSIATPGHPSSTTVQLLESVMYEESES
jgi:hypothetical protein